MNIITVKWILFTMFTFLWIGDTVATIQFVSVLGLESEANPLMRSLIANHGFFAFIMLKIGVLFLWASLVKYTHWTIHLLSVMILTPVVYMGTIVALSTI